MCPICKHQASCFAIVAGLFKVSAACCFPNPFSTSGRPLPACSLRQRRISSPVLFSSILTGAKVPLSGPRAEAGATERRPGGSPRPPRARGGSFSRDTHSTAASYLTNLNLLRVPEEPHPVSPVLSLPQLAHAPPRRARIPALHLHGKPDIRPSTPAGHRLRDAAPDHDGQPGVLTSCLRSWGCDQHPHCAITATARNTHRRLRHRAPV